MLEGGLGVVGRVDEDALHPSGINRQQAFEGIQVVPLDEEIPGGGVAVIEGRLGYQGTIRHGTGRLDGFFLARPVQGGHEANTP